MKRKFYPNTILQVFGLLLSPLILISPLVLLEGKIFVTNHDVLTTLIFIVYFIALISIFYLINRQGNIKIDWRCNAKYLSILPIAILIVIIFQLGLNSPVNSIIKNVFGLSNPTVNHFDTLIFLLGAAILGPIFEEIIFRGIILRGLLLSYSPKYAIIISSVIFGLIHIKLFQIWGAILLGLFFGLIYYKTQNILITIILHSISNMSSFLNSYIFYKFFIPNLSSNTIKYINVFVVVISLIILITVFRKFITRMISIEVEPNELNEK